MKNKLRGIARRSALTVLILAEGIAIAFLLLLLVFMLPTESMKKNVESSLMILEQETAYRDLIPGIYTTKQDNYTDSEMLSSAIYSGQESLVDRVVNNYAYVREDGNYTDDLIYYLQTGEYDFPHEYFWYWHGYQIVLKPLLSVFDYADIRLLNTFMQMGCLVLLFLELYKNGYKRYILPFIVAFFLLSPSVIHISLQFSSCYYIMLLSGIVILHFRDTLEKKNGYWLLFLITGMVVSFFDFLTYPAITLGFLLLLYYMMNQSHSLKKMAARMVECGFFWGVGYALFWAGKWVVASIALDKNCFVKAFEKIGQHTSTDSGDQIYTRQDAFFRNFNWMETKGYTIIILIILIYLLIRLFRYGIDKKELKCAIPYLVLATLPFCWYFFASSHAFYHYWMEYRLCFLLLAGVYGAIVRCTREPSFDAYGGKIKIAETVEIAEAVEAAETEEDSEMEEDSEAEEDSETMEDPEAEEDLEAEE